MRGGKITRWLKGLPLLLAVALLAGCAPFGIQNINDLLRAPAMGEERGKVQQALADELGDAPEYKFPKEGAQRSPMIMQDLDGDGQDEAIVLYGLPSAAATGGGSSNVYIAVLSRQEDGEWAVVQNEEGAASDVASFEVADLLSEGVPQVLVGYATANLGSKTLALYRYRDGRLVLEPLISYSRYKLDDFTGRGGLDLVVVLPDDQTAGLRLRYIPAADGAFDYSHDAIRLGAGFNLTSCVGLYASASASGERLIVADCLVAETDMLVSSIVYYSGERFYTTGTDIQISETGRQNRALTARDIDGDGIVEIPQRVGKEPVITPNGDKNLEFVKWIDFTGETPQMKQFGIFDADRGCYVRLPDSWLEEEKGEDRLRVRVVDGRGEGEWALENETTRRKLFSVQIYEPGEEPPGNAKPMSEASGAYLVPQTSLPMSEWNMIEAVQMN